MNKFLTIFAAAATLAVANTTLAPVAEAGGGVRLQFGYPLGSFVARPCGSCGSSSSYSHRSHRDYGESRRAAAKAEARREAIAEARRERAAAAKAAARREAIADARREKAEARHAAIAQARRETRLAKQNETDVVAKAEIETVAPEAVPLPVRPAKEADVAIGEPKVILSEPKTIEKKVAAAPVRPEVENIEAPAKPLDCKKFVPSAGLTITVPCQ